MQSHFHANILFLVHLYFHVKNIVSNVVFFMQLHFHANILFFYSAGFMQFSCKHIVPNIEVFMQLHFRANIFILRK